MDDSVEAEQIQAPAEDPSNGESSPGVASQATGPTPDQNGDGELRDQVLDALRHVHDPELGINIVDLGLVYGVDIEGDTVHITYTLTTMGCPIGPMIEAEIKQLLSGVEGVENVDAEMVLRPPWTPEMMSDEAKAALGFF